VFCCFVFFLWVCHDSPLLALFFSSFFLFSFSFSFCWVCSFFFLLCCGFSFFLFLPSRFFFPFILFFFFFVRVSGYLFFVFSVSFFVCFLSFFMFLFFFFPPLFFFFYFVVWVLSSFLFVCSFCLSSFLGCVLFCFFFFFLSLVVGGFSFRLGGVSYVSFFIFDFFFLVVSLCVVCFVLFLWVFFVFFCVCLGFLSFLFFSFLFFFFFFFFFEAPLISDSFHFFSYRAMPFSLTSFLSDLFFISDFALNKKAIMVFFPSPLPPLPSCASSFVVGLTALPHFNVFTDPQFSPLFPPLSSESFGLPPENVYLTFFFSVAPSPFHFFQGRIKKQFPPPCVHTGAFEYTP